MIEFLSKRLAQVRERKTEQIQREQLIVDRTEELKADIALVKELLKDQRYGRYFSLLTQSRDSLLLEREAVLEAESDRDVRDHQAAILTGRIMQLNRILETPDSFLALAEQGKSKEGNGRPPMPERAARSPAR